MEVGEGAEAQSELNFRDASCGRGTELLARDRIVGRADHRPTLHQDFSRVKEDLTIAVGVRTSYRSECKLLTLPDAQARSAAVGRVRDLEDVLRLKEQVSPRERG